jgi:hypothetical protein
MTSTIPPSVAPIRPFQDAYLYNYSNEHLLYECQQFFWVSNVLGQGVVAQWVSDEDQRTLINNTFIENYALHLRSVIDFLCPSNSPHATDITANDFCASGVWTLHVSPMPSLLCAARKRANKEIAHLTSDRSLLTDQNRIWDYNQLSPEITRILRLFHQHAEKNRLGDRVIAFIGSL